MSLAPIESYPDRQDQRDLVRLINLGAHAPAELHRRWAAIAYLGMTWHALVEACGCGEASTHDHRETPCCGGEMCCPYAEE